MTPFAWFSILVILATWIALCIHDRRAALAAFCGLLPAYLLRVPLTVPGVGTLPTTLLELLFLTLFIVWLFTDGREKRSWEALDEWALPITLFVTGATVSLALAPDLRAALGLWRAYIIEPVLFFVMFVDVLSRAKRGTQALAALGVTLAVVGAIAVFQKFTGFGIPNPTWQAEATRRVTAFYGFPNGIGLFAAPVTVLMTAWTVSLFSKERAWAKKVPALLPAGAALLGAAGIAFAVSEGAMIGVAAGVAMLGLLDKRFRAWTLGAIIAACLITSLWVPVRNYATSIVMFQDDSGSVRRIIWSETIAMLADHPVFGAGLSGYPGRIAPYHAATHIEVFQYPHNIFLNFWSEMGLIGLAAFLWIISRFFSIAISLYTKNEGWLPAALIAAMTALLVHGLVDVPYFKNDLAILFWILVGLAEAMRRSKKLA